MGTSEEHCEASAGRWQTVALLVSAAWDGLVPAPGRTGTEEGAHRGARRSSGLCHSSQRVSTKSLGELQSRMTTRIGAPQVGQRAIRGGGGVCWGSGSSLGWACTIMRRIVARGAAPRAWRKPT